MVDTPPAAVGGVQYKNFLEKFAFSLKKWYPIVGASARIQAVCIRILNSYPILQIQKIRYYKLKGIDTNEKKNL